MRRVAEAVFFISLSLVIGCAHIPFLGKSSEQSKEAAKPDFRERKSLEPSAFVEKGRIVNDQRLQQGQDIAIFPFTAGIGVEATEELNRTALMIIKGISDTFTNDDSGKHGHFNVLTAENSQEADLIIKGHITDMGGPSKIKRWVLLKGEKRLRIEGKVTDTNTGEAIVIFIDHAKTSAREEDYKQLGYRIGRNIGRFILSGI